MEFWIILGVLGYLSYSISSALDKYLMNKGYDPLLTNTMKMFFDGIVLLIVGILFFKIKISLNLIYWSVLLGIIYGIAGILYYKSLQLKDVQQIIPFIQASSILLIFFCAIFILKESANLSNYLGVFILVIGIFLVLSDKKTKIPKFDKAFYLITVAVILIVIFSLIVKVLLDDIQPIDLSITMYFSSALFLFFYVLFIKKRKELFKIKRSTIVVSAVFGSLGTFLMFMALAIADASKVYSLGGIQSVFIFAIAVIFLKEKFLWHRLLGVLMILIGIFLVTI